MIRCTAAVRIPQRRELPSREVRVVVRRDQQHPISQRQRPLPAFDPVRDELPATTLDLGDQPPERPRHQSGERLGRLRTRRGAPAARPDMITDRLRTTYETQIEL